MRRTALFVAAVRLACGQTFEVASVKPAAPYKGGPIHIGVSGGPGTDDPGRLTFSNATLGMILVNAFGIEFYQIAGPDWLSNDMFDIVAKVPEGATKEEMWVMMRNLLAERFGMVSHREKRDLPSYVLTVGRGGPKMKISGSGMAAEKPRTTSPVPGVQRVTCMKCSVSQFVSMLGTPLDRPIYDQTGLTGAYDFTLTWEPEFRSRPGMVVGGGGPPAPSAAARDSFADTAPILVTAVEDQLGLKLEVRKVPTDVVVIDRIDRTPSAN